MKLDLFFDKKSKNTEINEVQVKSILNKHKRRDSWSLLDYTLNPFTGCEFNCLDLTNNVTFYLIPRDCLVHPGHRLLVRVFKVN